MTAPIDFLLITALEEERDAVLNRLPNYRQLPPNSDDVRVYYSASIEARQGNEKCTYSVIVCMVGMGRVPATTGTTDAIRQWLPDYVVLIGIAGGLKAAGIGLGDILIAEQIADYQSQKITKGKNAEIKTEIRWTAHPVDHRLLEFSRSMSPAAWQAEIRETRPNKDEGLPKRHTGTLTTGDAVIAVSEILESFKNQNWPKLIGVEMEAGGAGRFRAPVGASLRVLHGPLRFRPGR